MPAANEQALPASRFNEAWARATDLVERLFLFVLLGWFLMRLIPSFSADPYNILIVVSEAFTAFLVLIRKRGPMAATFYAWLIAIVGTCAPLLVSPDQSRLIQPWIGGMMMFAGLLISVSAKICLNRSFGIVAANRGVKHSGPYRVVRHPMYLGYFISHIGFVLTNLSWWNVTVYAVTWIGLLLRIEAEESFLNRDDCYGEYSRSVRYRLIPGLY